ncbi:hypothetical protein ACFWP3_36105 [Streptomyces sp. NPDC058525]|uniref:hypothetical protein n=1 Tax=Streptomyces sp. NPDC058525 TaxID=3346538 RepID=UPI0036540D3C
MADPVPTRPDRATPVGTTRPPRRRTTRWPVTRIRLADDGPTHVLSSGRTGCGLFIRQALDLRVCANFAPITCPSCIRLASPDGPGTPAV